MTGSGVTRHGRKAKTADEGIIRSEGRVSAKWVPVFPRDNAERVCAQPMLNQKLRSAMVNQLDPIALQASAFAL
jgi:hypothetical protein